MAEITQTIPAREPSDTNSLEGLCRLIKDVTLMDMDKVLPGIVHSYDRTSNRAVVKPAITGVASLGQKIPKNALVNIPVLTLQGGGIFLSFPLKEGDKGWLVACDRDISVFKQMLEESSPNSYRKHCFNDAFFIPDKINQLIIAEDDSDALVISTVSGETKFALKDGKIKLTGNTTIIGETTINGNLTVSGDVVGSGISLVKHTHGGVQTGSGNTGVPQ